MEMFQLLEQSDVFADACAADHRSQLLFLSVYGRDTSLQQLMARLHQPLSQGGVDTITVQAPGTRTEAIKVLVGDARRLEKVTGRMPKAGLLGNLVHAWIFDPQLMELDHATRSAWIFSAATDNQSVDSQTWSLVKELSSVPLLDCWRDHVMRSLRSQGALAATPAAGPIQALRVELPESFPDQVSLDVREGALMVPSAVLAG